MTKNQIKGLRWVLGLSLLFWLCFFASLAHCQRANTQYVLDFPGVTQGAKTTAAQAACLPDASVTCIIVLDSPLSKYALGIMPSKCVQCVWVDYRTGAPWSVASYVGNLPGWSNALANLQQSPAATKLSVAYIGDSYATGGNITGPLTTALQSRYGAGGVGWINFYYLSSINPGITIGAAGTWATQRNNPNAVGLNISDVRTSDTATPARITVTSTQANVQSATLYYLKQPGGGTFKWWVDSNTAITIDTASSSVGIGSSTISGLVGTTVHTFQVQILTAGTAGIALCGMDARATASGIVVHNLGSAGSNTGNWVSVNQSLWQAQLAALNPSLVTIMLTPNDQADGVSVAQQYVNLQNLIGRIKSAVPAASVLLMPSPENGLGRTPLMSEYNQSQQNLAAALGVGYLDIYGAVGVFNPLYFNSDLLHPNAVGGSVIANAILQGLNVNLAAGSISYDGKGNALLAPSSAFVGDSAANYGTLRLTSALPTKGSSVVMGDASVSVLPFKIAYNDACTSGVDFSPATAAQTNLAPPTWGTQNLCFFSGYTKMYQALRGSANYSGGGSSYGTLTLSPDTNAAGSALVFKELSASVTNWMVSHHYLTSNALEFTPSTAAGGVSFTTPVLKLLPNGVTMGQPLTLTNNSTAISRYAKYTATLSPSQVAANTCAAQSLTVTGVISGDVVLKALKPTEQAGLSLIGARVTGSNTVSAQFCNNTAAAITPTASESYTFVVVQ